MTADTSDVCHDASPMCQSVTASLRTPPPLRAFEETFGGGMPSMPPTCPNATWIPTPVRKPTSTVRDRKFARNPSRVIRASRTRPAASSALRLARATHCGVSGWRPETPSPAMPAYMIAAVAESPPTTRCLDEPKSAKAASGMSIV